MGVKDNNANRTSEADSYKVGHRKRMREKFLESKDDDSFGNTELLEILLYLIYPRGDVKPIAYRLIEKYKNLNKFIIASLNLESRREMEKLFGNNILFLSKLIRLTLKKSLISEIKEETVLSRWNLLCEYLKVNFGYLEHERFSVLYLDHAFKLIDTCQFGSGTIDESTVYVREIVKSGLSRNAKYIVMCHNHISGKVEPSDADIETTKQTILACKIVNMEVLDHIIVSGDNLFSFKNADLI